MYPAEFSAIIPRTLDEVLDALSKYEDARVLAGGQSLIPLMKLRVLTPKYIIYLGKVPGLSYIRVEGDKLVIGAMTTHAEIASSDIARSRNPLISEVASKIGDLQVRNMGTIGGSLAHADPAADYPAAILALEGEVVARSKGGARVIKAQEFFKDAYTTDLRRGELITEVRLPVLGNNVGTAYEKLVFRATDFAIVGAAVVLHMDGNRVVKARVALTGVGSTPVRARGVEEELEGKSINEELIIRASRRASEGLKPPSDIRATSEYRRDMAVVMVKRALLRAYKARG